MKKRQAKVKPEPFTIVRFVTEPEFLGLSISPAQETLLRACYGLPLTEEQFDIFRACTGRTLYHQGHSFREVTIISGARSGKDSRIACPIAIYEALLGGHDKRLAKGEVAIIPLVAQDKTAAQIAFGYIKDYLTESPTLR